MMYVHMSGEDYKNTKTRPLPCYALTCSSCSIKRTSRENTIKQGIWGGDFIHGQVDIENDTRGNSGVCYSAREVLNNMVVFSSFQNERCEIKEGGRRTRSKFDQNHALLYLDYLTSMLHVSRC